MQLKYLICFFLTLILPLSASALMCDVCEKDIDGKYIKTAKGNYCSKKCYHSTIEKCSFCKEPCLRQNLRMMDKVFCSKRCMFKVFKCSECGTGLEQVFTLSNPLGTKEYYCYRCRKLPRCYFCAMPTGENAVYPGMITCRRCCKTAVNDEREIRKIFHRVRLDLKEMFGYDFTHRINLSIVDVPTLNKESGSIYSPPGSRQMALMRYQNKEQIRKYPNGRVERKMVYENCRIFVLKGVPRAMLIDAIAHELTHDYLRHNVGNVKELANEEGFCELIASIYNIRIGNAFLNKAKEVNPDPVYGGGFRKMRAIYKQTGSIRQTLKYVR